MAKKEKKARKGKKKVAAAKKTTKKSAAKKSGKRTAAKRTPTKRAPVRKAKAAKSPAPKPAAKKAIVKAPAKKPVAVAAPPVPAVPPTPKAVAPPPKPVMRTATVPKPFVAPPRPAAPAPAPMAPPTETATKPTAKLTASPFGLPKDEIAKFDLPKMDVPAAFHELADTGFVEAKENDERIQQTGNEMTAILEETYSTAAKGIADYNLKLLEIARTHTSALFDFARKLATSKSLSEVIEFSTAHARHQFDRVSAQNKELLTLAQKVAIETAEAAQWAIRNY